MKRVNINIKGDIPVHIAIAYVYNVMLQGRISAESFCYHTEFKDNVCVSARQTEQGNDTFTVWRKSDE